MNPTILLNFFDKLEQNMKSRSLSSAKLAEDSAAYPDLSIKFPNCETAFDFICAYGALLMIIDSTNYNAAYDFLEFMNKKAFHYNYQGKWNLVKELVQTPRIYYYNDYMEFLFAHFSSEDIFGNIARRIAYYMEHPKKYKKSQSRNKVRYPNRKRGYTDKGSRRPNEKWLPRIYNELYSYEEEQQRVEIVEVTPPRRKTEWIHFKNKGSV